jgi:hypothetical protein
MSNPRETVIGAHSGRGRWRQPDAVSARLVQGGARPVVKGQQARLPHTQRDLNGVPPWES